MGTAQSADLPGAALQAQNVLSNAGGGGHELENVAARK